MPSLFGVLLLLLACGQRPGSDPTQTQGEAEQGEANSEGADGRPEKLPAPATSDKSAIIRALTAENASLRRQLAEGARPDPYASLGIINSHEHLHSLKYLDGYLQAARRANVAATVFVASPSFTLFGKGEKGEPGMSENFDELLKAAAAYPGEVIPFCTLDPHDPDKLARLKRHVAAGARGLKLYSGHSNFYDGPLNAPGMDEVLSYLEETGLPLNWHVHLGKYADELAVILNAHPRLNIMVPHYGVAFWQPRSRSMAALHQLLAAHRNLYIDTSLGTREILLDGMAVMEQDPMVFLELFRQFPDQIIWGTDSVVTGNSEKTPAWFSRVIWATRDQLERDVLFTDLAAGFSKYYQTGRDANGRYKGLNLDPALLRKVYHDNPMAWLKLEQSPTPPVAPGQVPAAP